MGYGIGNSSAGLGIAGFGTTTQAPAVGNNFLPDPQTNSLRDAPLIDFGGTQDLVYNASGELAGMDSVDQQVFLAVATVSNTSINPHLGTDLGSILVIGSSTPAQIRNRIENALATLVSQQLITSLVVTSAPDALLPSRLNVSISYFNNRSNVQRTLTF